MNESENLINDIIQPVIERIDAALDDINDSTHFSSKERQQLTAQFGTCCITLSAFEHKLRSQRLLDDTEMLDLQTVVHNVASLLANYEYFNRSLREYWSNMNPGTEQQREADTR